MASDHVGHAALHNLKAVVAAVRVSLDLENCKLELDSLPIIDPDCPCTVGIVRILSRVARRHEASSGDPSDKTSTLGRRRVVHKVEPVVRHRMVRPELHED